MRLKIEYAVSVGIDTPWYVGYCIISIMACIGYAFLISIYPMVIPVFINQTVGCIQTISAYPTHTTYKPVNLNYWIFDTGAGRHMSRDLEHFSNLRPIKPIQIDGIGGSLCSVSQGTYRGTAQTPLGVWEPITLFNVLYVENLPVPHLFSFPQASKRGCTAGINDSPYIRTPSGSSIQMKRSESGYLGLLIYGRSLSQSRINELNLSGTATFFASPSMPVCTTTSLSAFPGLVLASPVWSSISINSFHEKYGHLGLSRMKILAKSLRVKLVGEWTVCHTCSQTKVHRGVLQRDTSSRRGKFLERIFVDLAGPFPSSTGGNRYVMTIVDDWSRFSWVYFLPNRSHITLVKYLQHFMLKSQNKVDRVLFMRTDNEFQSKWFDAFVLQYGFNHELTPPYTPEFNGVVERRIAMLKTVAMSYLMTANLSVKLRSKLWAEAFSHANSVLNMSPTSCNAMRSPADVAGITVRKPSLIFGSIVYLLNEKVTQGDMDPKGQLGIYLGESIGELTSHPSGTIRAFKVDTQASVSSRNYSAHDGVFISGSSSTIITSSPLVPDVLLWLRTDLGQLIEDDVRILHSMIPSETCVQKASAFLPVPMSIPGANISFSTYRSADAESTIVDPSIVGASTPISPPRPIIDHSMLSPPRIGEISVPPIPISPTSNMIEVASSGPSLMVGSPVTSIPSTASPQDSSIHIKGGSKCSIWSKILW